MCIMEECVSKWDVNDGKYELRFKSLIGFFIRKHLKK